MVGNEEHNNNGQTSTAAAAKHEEKKEAAACSSSSSENIDEEDDFFQIEGPILGTQFSLGAPEGECPDPKRIPSSVFARSKSTTPTDWSVTSNESLFSINVGNASFSKDHLFLYGKSGEMGNPNDPLPPLPRQSLSPVKGEAAPPPPSMVIGESSAKVKPAASCREKPGGDADYVNSLSHRSDGSTTSFAFPILTSEEKSSGCVKDNQAELSRQSTAQLSQPAEPLDEKEEKPEAAVEMEAPKVEEAPVQAPAAEQPPATPTKWFPCCSCCPFCC